MAFPYDENFEEDSGVFDPTERPTESQERRRRRRQLAQDPDYRQGRMMNAIIELRHDVDSLQRDRITVAPPMPQPRPSLKPHVATAGISVTAGGIAVVIIEVIKQLILKK